MGSRGHAILGVIVCVVVPLGSWLSGPSPGYTMFAGYTDFRLECRVWEGAEARPISPAALLPYASGYLKNLLAMGEAGGRVRSVDALRPHLGDVAALACEVPRATRIELALHETDETGHLRVTRASRACAR
ncbi:MAG: hypothetical protein HOO96_26750 [Polyangiaceae bacterium]|nr:hypothetical protein [Polyangiaceae bacterium]